MIFDEVIFDEVIFDEVIFDEVIFDEVIFDEVIFDEVVFDEGIFDLVLDPLPYLNLQLKITIPLFLSKTINALRTTNSSI